MGEAFDAGGGGRVRAGEAWRKRLMTELYGASARQDAARAGVPRDAPRRRVEKFLFFAHHKVMLDAATELLLRRRRRHVRSTAPRRRDRQKLVDEFQNDEGTRVAVLSIKAAGMGLTLTAASLVVFGELSWTPGDIVQAEDRAHRIGQVNSVDVKFLCAKTPWTTSCGEACRINWRIWGRCWTGPAEIVWSWAGRRRRRPDQGTTLGESGGIRGSVPGGGPRRDDFAALRPPKRQATLDGFVAKRDWGRGRERGRTVSRERGRTVPRERHRRRGVRRPSGKTRRLHGLAALQRRGETTAA